MKLLKSILFGVTSVFVMGYFQQSFAQMCGYGSENSPACYGYHAHQREQSANQDAANQAAANEETQHQWQIQEEKTKARIAKFRNTPSYGAIVLSTATKGIAWGGGYRTSEKAIQRAFKVLGSNEGQILAIISNTCAGVSAPEANQNTSNIIVALDNDAKAALHKAWNQCEVKYGKDKCVLKNNGDAMCSGYDYGVFTK